MSHAALAQFRINRRVLRSVKIAEEFLNLIDRSEQKRERESNRKNEAPPLNAPLAVRHGHSETPKPMRQMPARFHVPHPSFRAERPAKEKAAVPWSSSPALVRSEDYWVAEVVALVVQQVVRPVRDGSVRCQWSCGKLGKCSSEPAKYPRTVSQNT
jgi:hypothetical protein